MYKAIGKFRYSPKLDGTARVSSKWWLVMDCDPEIGSYYRHLHSICNWRLTHWQKPAWEVHISVIRNEEPLNPGPWERYNGESVEFEYGPGLLCNETYLWLPVKCERALDVRVELGLPRDPYYALHLTVGNRRML